MVTPRLFVEGPLEAGGALALSAEQAHYLANVLRLKAGAELRLFNGADGEWSAHLTLLTKRGATAALDTQRRVQTPSADLHLLFAPLKKTRTDFVVEKATELGVAALRPVFTQRTDASRVNAERLGAIAREAAEQCERLDAPAVRPAVALMRLLDGWGDSDAGRRILFCDEAAGRADTPWADETSGAPAAASALAAVASGPWAVLIGPEGGFSPEERDCLRALDFAVAVHLGPRILRADTAAVAALTLWQSALGDWA